MNDTENIRNPYLTTETFVSSSSATSGIAGMNEPKTKTLCYTSGKKTKVVPSRSQSAPRGQPSNGKQNRRTGNETGPRNERDDGVFAARRKPRIDEIVVSFGGFLRAQKWRLF